MSNFVRVIARKSPDHGAKRRAFQRRRAEGVMAAKIHEEHRAKIEPIAPDGIAQPGARRKAS